jgi:hypothetical protein
MKTLQATRYVSPLKEGGSLPAIVEASDSQLWVAKFRGAGQGARALVAEWICGELARACGFAVPELSRIELDEAFGRNEPDPEIRDLLRASHGANLGMAFLPGALTYDPAAPPEVSETLASELVWFDSFVMNVDRSARNPNLLLAGGQLWLIDHGAALYFHHAWGNAAASSASPFAAVKRVLRARTQLSAAAERLGEARRRAARALPRRCRRGAHRRRRPGRPAGHARGVRRLAAQAGSSRRMFTAEGVLETRSFERDRPRDPARRARRVAQRGSCGAARSTGCAPASNWTASAWPRSPPAPTWR